MPGRLLAVFAAAALFAPAAATAGPSPNEASLLRQMNQARALHGLHALHYDSRLERAARTHSRQMLDRNAFTHGAFGSRLAAFGIRDSLAGENLAWGLGSKGTPRAVVAAWLASPEHRANLLRPAFRRVGLGDVAGTFKGHRGARVVTADFVG